MSLSLAEQVKEIELLNKQYGSTIQMLRTENQRLSSSNRLLTNEGNRLATIVESYKNSDQTKEIADLRSQLDQERESVKVKVLNQRLVNLQNEMVKMKESLDEVAKLRGEKQLVCNEVVRLQSLLQLEVHKNKALQMEINILLEQDKGVSLNESNRASDR
jgi:hypothetical protein